MFLLRLFCEDDGVVDGFWLRKKFLCLFSNGASGVLIYFVLQLSIMCVMYKKLDRFALNKNAFSFSWADLGDINRFFCLFWFRILVN